MSVSTEDLAKKIHIYSNGDRFFTGRRFVINPRHTRNYEAFLNQVTYSLKPAFGAVRVLRTPENGHPVHDLQELETGRSYVACAQKFVKLGYEEITTSKPKQVPSPERRTRIVASGRIRKIERHPIAIFVYTNGDNLEPARRILLKPWVQRTWGTVLSAISEKITLRTGAVRHILDMETKAEVTEGIHLKNNGNYVAVGSEKYKDLEYGSVPVVLSPKQQQKRRYPHLNPLKKKKGDNSTGSSPLESSIGSTESSTGKQSGATEKKRVRKPPPPAEEEGIPIKPVKHKRAEKPKEEPEPKLVASRKLLNKESQKKELENKPPVVRPAVRGKLSKSVDLDQDTPRSIDESGVYKSKSRREKAKQIVEDKNTKTEVPVSRRKAETVKEEVQLTKSLSPKRSSQPTKPESHPKPEPRRTREEIKPVPPKEKNPRPMRTKAKTLGLSANEEIAALRIQAGYRGYKVRKDMNCEKGIPTNEEEQAATKIQASFRDHKVRKDLNLQKTEITITNESKEEKEAAIRIQAGYRGYKVRKDMKYKPQQFRTIIDASEQEIAATKIQANYRGHKVRKEMRDKMKDNDGEELATTRIQANYRSHKVRKEMKNKMKDNDDEVLAATRIQANYRGHKVRKEMKDNDDEQLAATRIQANYRGYKTRKELQFKGLESLDAGNGDSLEEINAAVKIQANYRGFKTRKHLKASGEARDGDEETEG